MLIKSFEEEPLPNFDQRQAMAKQLGMTPRSVQIWFQNRRQRLKPISKSASAPDLPSQTSGSHGSAHFGMPGLAAAAGLFGGGLIPGASSQLPMPSGGFGVQPFLSSEVMEPFAATKALLGANYQHSQSSILGLGLRFPHGSAAMGIGSAREQLMQQAVAAAQQQQQAQQHQVHQAHQVHPAHAAASSLDVGPTPSTHATFVGGDDGSSTMIHRSQSSPDCGAYGASASQQQAAPAAADGLLLLLACAGGNGEKTAKDEQPPAPTVVSA